MLSKPRLVFCSFSWPTSAFDPWQGLVVPGVWRIYLSHDLQDIQPMPGISTPWEAQNPGVPRPSAPYAGTLLHSLGEVLLGQGRDLGQKRLPRGLGSDSSTKVKTHPIPGMATIVALMREQLEQISSISIAHLSPFKSILSSGSTTNSNTVF